MLDEFTRLLAVNGYLPHGYCLSWSPTLVATYVVSDVLIFLSYFSMPLALGYFAHHRRDFPYRWVLWLFSAFIMACGITHLMGAIVLWQPMYALDALLRAVTAVISVATAIALWPLIPRALKLPSPAQLQLANEALAREIEERKKMEEALRLTNAALEDALQRKADLMKAVVARTAELQDANARLAASSQDLTRSNQELEQFAYVASHDLQEPLRMVVGFVQLLEKRLGQTLDAESREFMNFAVDGAMRMQRLIRDILSYSRVSSRSAPLTLVDSAAAVQEALTLLANTIAETGAVVQAVDLPTVTADHTQLVQLFQNLIGNAIKFCRQGTPNVQVRAYRDGEKWRFTVTDNGIGIAEEYRERIFGIFQRLHTREEYDGTGIGLAICKRIVQRHAGSIGVDKAAGGGSVFWFTLNEEKNK